MTASFNLDAKSFKKRLKAFARTNHRRFDEIFEATVDLAEESIVWGSARTGAPGQPVHEEVLRPSYRRIVYGRYDVAIASPLIYAGIIEHNTRGATLRSSVGGFHSIRITHLNLRWAIRADVERITREVTP